DELRCVLNSAIELIELGGLDKKKF
ncbi:unnamed protein product, partial [Didymodactylos carnosus]